MSEAHGWQLTVLRPGFIWGLGNECPPGSIGRSIGRVHLVFGGFRQLPFTHVANCADCFRAAVESPKPIGQTLNVIDDHAITAWGFMGEYLRRSRTKGVRVLVPYWVMRLMTAAIYLSSRAILGSRAKLPSLFVPARLAQGYSSDTSKRVKPLSESRTSASILPSGW